MFKRIEICNFQSHKKTSIDLTNGINAVTGSSDNGKSAIIRAIRWVAENKPSGTDKINSFWNEKFQEDMCVTLYRDDDNYIKRFRNKKENGYIIVSEGKEKELLAIGQDLPSEVEEFFNFSDVNTQYQFDSPFLLSVSDGEKNKYINKLINLEIIDNLFSLAEKDKRAVNAELKIKEKENDDLEVKINELSWVDEAETMLADIDNVSKLLDNETKLVNDLQSDILDFEDLEKSIYNFEKENKLIEEIEKIEIEDLSSLQSDILDFEDLLLEVEMLDDRIKVLTDLLPDVCPECGQVIMKS